MDKEADSPEPREHAPSPEPGWYSSPSGGGRRYWDGDQWTDVVATSDSPPGSAPLTRITKVGLVACALLALGSCGPWVTSIFVTVGGLSGDGVITLLVAAVSTSILVFARTSQRRVWPVLVGVCGTLALATTVHDFIQIEGSATTVFGEDVQLGAAGWGLWLSLASSGLLTVIGWLRVAELSNGEGAARAGLLRPGLAALGLATAFLAVTAIGIASAVDASEVCRDSADGDRVDCDAEGSVSDAEYDDIAEEREIEEAEQAAAEEAEEEAESARLDCEFEIGSLLDELSTLNSRLEDGLTLRSYANQVQSIRFAYDSTSPRRLSDDCAEGVAVPAEESVKAYVTAGQAWQRCLEDPSCPDDSVDPLLQREWDDASESLDEAEDGLSAIGSP